MRREINLSSLQRRRNSVTYNNAAPLFKGREGNVHHSITEEEYIVTTNTASF
jgi:hypothetical protein